MGTDLLIHLFLLTVKQRNRQLLYHPSTANNGRVESEHGQGSITQSRSLKQVSHMRGRDPSSWTASCCLPKNAFAGSWNQSQNWDLTQDTLFWDADILNSILILMLNARARPFEKYLWISKYVFCIILHLNKIDFFKKSPILWNWDIFKMHQTKSDIKACIMPYCFKPLPATMASHKCDGWRHSASNPAPCNAPGKAVKHCPIFGSLPSIWETHVEVWSPGFGLTWLATETTWEE